MFKTAVFVRKTLQKLVDRRPRTERRLHTGQSSQSGRARQPKISINRYFQCTSVLAGPSLDNCGPWRSSCGTKSLRFTAARSSASLHSGLPISTNCSQTSGREHSEIFGVYQQGDRGSQKPLNLTDEKYIAYEGTYDKPTEVEQIGARYMFGVRFNF